MDTGDLLIDPRVLGQSDNQTLEKHHSPFPHYNHYHREFHIQMASTRVHQQQDALFLSRHTLLYKNEKVRIDPPDTT